MTTVTDLFIDASNTAIAILAKDKNTRDAVANNESAWYILTNNTHSNIGTIVLAGPFDTQDLASNCLSINGYKWGNCSIEYRLR